MAEKKPKKRKLPFHRLTVDLEPELYDKLKKYADAEERTPSKQAKIFLANTMKQF